MTKLFKMSLLGFLALFIIACNQNKNQASSTNSIQYESELEKDNSECSQIEDFEKTTFTWEDSKGDLYPVYMKTNGSCFVLKKSKSGKNYRVYLGREASNQILNEMKNKHNNN